MTRILLISGSQRRESYNTRLLLSFAELLAGRCDIDFLDGPSVQLPLFNQDIEHDATLRAKVDSLHRRVTHADALIVAAPEYNCLPSPYLKNLVDWISRLAYIDANFRHAFHGRPLLLCSASTGWTGGAIGLTAARAMFSYLGALVIGEQICVPRVDRVWTHDGYAFDDAFMGYIDAVLTRVLALANQQLPEVLA